MTRDEQRKGLIDLAAHWLRRIADSSDMQSQWQFSDWLFGLCESAVAIGLMDFHEAKEWHLRARGARDGFRNSLRS